MLRFYFNPKYKYTNRSIISIDGDTKYIDIDYANIDSPDTINGHIIFQLAAGQNLPTYIVDLENCKRWFVSGLTQLRTNKFQISLLRDIISENPELWRTEEAYINAGLATDYNRYKRWNLPFTNTKVAQQRLNINGQSSFFVFYVNKQEITQERIIEEDLKIKSTSIPNITAFDYEVASLNEIPGFEYVNAGELYHWKQSKGTIRTMMHGVPEGPTPVTTYGYNFTYDSLFAEYPTLYPHLTVNGVLPIKRDGTPNQRIYINTNFFDFSNNQNNAYLNFGDAVKKFILDYEKEFGLYMPNASYNNLSTYVDKYILDTTTNKVYTIKKVVNNTINENIPLGGSATSSLLGSLKGINFPGVLTNPTDLPPNITKPFDGADEPYFIFQSTREICSFVLQEIGDKVSFDLNFSALVRKLPKSAVRCVNIVPSESMPRTSIEQVLMLAQTNGINPDNTTGRILDIQYLPFSIANKTNENFMINDTPLIAQFIENDDIFYKIDLPDLNNVNKETDTIKIVSPSRASQYLFRPYDNGGSMKFDFKCTLRPYTSTLYIRPSTKGLLIFDWDDKDCLIINEDFSLTNVTSQWTEYVYNNRNYQNAFERTIQGRELERTWERRVEEAQKQADWNTARNISAEKARTYTGNIPIISSVAAGIGSMFADAGYLQAAEIDRQYNEAMYQESISLARDQFAFQLDNIKSQPLVPSKVTAFDIKSLDGIYLEFYGTNESEKQAIEYYYKYNGNRVDAYGTFSQYWGWFVRGKIIISKYYTQPEIDELNRRLATGIFTEVNYD